ncbi:MAG: fibronectin type III domain-containing protein, partial [Pontiellaceae bacterium]|nr:fibronectin type III domain-containing protein [Pontiellaceae bacterium]
MRCARIDSIELHYYRYYREGEDNTVSLVGLGNWMPDPSPTSGLAYAYIGSSARTSYGTHALGNTEGWKDKTLPAAACQELEDILSQESGSMIFGIGFLSTNNVAKFLGYDSISKPNIVVSYTRLVARNLHASTDRRDGILLEWEHPSETLRPAYYNIYRRPDDPNTPFFQQIDYTDGESNSYLDESADAETRYFYKIR